MFNNINFDYMENSNEIKKIDSSMVECPFCKNVIEAPSKPDVIFKCPQCDKELITYNITQSNKTLNTKDNMSLIYCRECGKQISSHAQSCPFCGYPQNEQNLNSKGISLGYLFISFLIPLIGIILCCISWNNDDRKAKSALIGTLVGVLFTAVIYSIL
ncbi:zinc-ribbon domain-containing protein [Bacteroides xylanisolvens]|jgi:ribosomal protein L37E|nr:zinc-ribbon domain-containing protein [Bacteroides xylanisolvens]MBX9170147.1 zinc-ribbon domain-containing protein [Bacteroides xylanisolvens]CUO89843.1 Uncharacterised protein family UPF0547 [Bacteroides xylanisolvens]